MNKEQFVDDPPWIWFVVVLNSTISKNTLDVAIAMYRTYASLEAFRAIEAALVKHDNNMKDYSQVGLITITANHSNYLVCDRANTQSVTVRKVVKLQLNYCMFSVIKWIYNIVLFGGKNADVHSSSLLIDVCSLLTLVSDGRLQWPRLSRTDFFCSRAMLICSITWLCDVAGCCSAGSVRWHEVAPYSVSLICIVWSCFDVKLMQTDSRYLRHNWLFDRGFDGPRSVVICRW